MTAVIALGALIASLGMLTPSPEIRGGESEGSQSDAVEVKANQNSPASLAEARGRARILHETIHGALQVMHRDFFREDSGQSIPSRSLDDVFRELARSHQVHVRWLAVNTDAMSIEHRPQNDFEHAAVKALAAGKQEFESASKDQYRRVGVIRLSAHCLKCHLPSRTSTKDRAAGLVITMPLKIDKDDQDATP